VSTRRAFISTLAGGFFAASIAVEAQQREKVTRVGLLLGGSPTAPALERVEAFKHGLHELGYLVGKNLAIEYRWAEGKPERFPAFAAELVRLGVDVIVAATTPAAQAAKNATATLPIVMVVIADPVGSGLVRSLPQPGGNITGLSFLAADLGPKQLQLLKEVVPEVSRVAVLWLPTNPGHTFILKGLEAAASTLRVTLQRVAVRGPDDFEGAFATMSKERVGGVIVLPEPLFAREGEHLADLAARNRLPAVYGVVDHTAAGGLMAYAVDDRDNWYRAAIYVDKILRGAKPADLPVEQPTKFQLVINLKTAKALGITIPQSLLLRADEVIQ
jgi:putative ABC transport system substrate-binding protein